ncbi:flagellar hook-length control protein FliK [Variovorax atrisoli]|uniref:flagellar hook-length control protein FliK n=1 Tax=Variovorax atrisoli TaxID=3394203 RepID=UPI000F94896D|nr:flagellar hook-length control protein FliK [Variovorax sp. 369]RTD94456.1 flagellar hook-length control protein FliK [Variovorax sp. 369]
MPSMIMPPVTTNAAAQPAAAPAASRGRGSDDAQGLSFGAALERSRSNGETRADAAAKDGSTAVAAADRKAGRKPGADDDTNKEDATLADPNLAFLGQPNSPLHALTLAGRSAAQAAGDGPADGLAKTAAADAAAVDVALDPALQALSAKAGATTAATATAADAQDPAGAAAAAAAKAAKEAAAQKPSAAAAQAAAPMPADAEPAASLHETARAAIAAQTMSVGFAKPVSAPAGSPVGAAAAGRGAASRAPAGSATAEQLAAAAQPAAAAGAQAAQSAVAASPSAAPVDGVDTQATVDPVALQQPVAQAAAYSSERAGDAAAAARPPTHTIAPEVGSDKWAPALGQQLLRMSASGHHTAELNLNPAGLGPLKVTLSMGDNQAQAMFVSAHESVRKAVEAALPQLRNSLSEQGITLGQASVGAEARQPNGNDAAFAQQQQGQQQNAARQQAGSTYPGAGRPATDAQAAPIAAARATAAAASRSGVDTFA